MSQTLAVLGAGSWGTALAIALSRAGHAVRLWTRRAGDAAAMTALRANTQFLPDIVLPPSLTATADLGQALQAADGVLVVVPSAAFREVLRRLKGQLPTPQLAWATKGFEQESGKLLHQLVAEELGPQLTCVAISGPSFAGEVALGQPTALTVASSHALAADFWVDCLHGGTVRAYRSDDLVGVQVGGAVKNVLAIAAGIADGLGFGANARAALITRGLAEVQRLGLALGARRDTFLGLSGVGDLVLTCTDDQSRNRRVGLALASGKSPDEAVAALGQVAEGVVTALAVQRLATSLDVPMPICTEVYRVLYEGRDVRQAVRDLMAREPSAEL